MFTHVQLCLPMFTLGYLFLPLFTHVHLCLPMFTPIYWCLHMFTRFYLCLPLFTPVYLHLTLFTCACLPMFTHVNSAGMYSSPKTSVRKRRRLDLSDCTPGLRFRLSHKRRPKASLGKHPWLWQCVSHSLQPSPGVQSPAATCNHMPADWEWMCSNILQWCDQQQHSQTNENNYMKQTQPMQETIKNTNMQNHNTVKKTLGNGR